MARDRSSYRIDNWGDPVSSVELVAARALVAAAGVAEAGELAPVDAVVLIDGGLAAPVGMTGVYSDVLHERSCFSQREKTRKLTIGLESHQSGAIGTLTSVRYVGVLMRKALLLYNPASGRRSQRRREIISTVADILRSAGARVVVEATRYPGSAARQVRELLPHGFDTVFVAGGDGTINDALQGMVRGEAALGIIPTGTGNVVAHDLGLPIDPLMAVQCLLKWKPRRIALGRIEFTGTRLGISGETAMRWFLAVCGVGGAATLVYDALSAHKRGLGMAAYYVHMLKLAVIHDFPPFKVEYLDQCGNFVQRTAVEADAVRVGNFGGLMGRWARAADLKRPYAQLIIFPSSNRLYFVHYTLARMLDTEWKTPGVEVWHTTQVRCTPIHKDRRLRAAADGEHLGGLPVKIEIVPNMLNLLMPP